MTTSPSFDPSFAATTLLGTHHEILTIHEIVVSNGHVVLEDAMLDRAHLHLVSGEPPQMLREICLQIFHQCSRRYTVQHHCLSIEVEFGVVFLLGHDDLDVDGIRMLRSPLRLRQQFLLGLGALSIVLPLLRRCHTSRGHAWRRRRPPQPRVASQEAAACPAAGYRAVSVVAAGPQQAAFWAAALRCLPPPWTRLSQ